jgi:hypothetical protein
LARGEDNVIDDGWKPVRFSASSPEKVSYAPVVKAFRGPSLLVIYDVEAIKS